MNNINIASSNDIKPDESLRLLIVDDDRDIVESLQDVLEIECDDYIVESAHDISSALNKARTFHPDIALLDIKLGSENGLDLIEALRKDTPDVTCIMMTAYRDVEFAVTAIRCGADDFLYKPLDPANLIKTLKRFQLNQVLLRSKLETERRFRAIFEQSFQFLFILDQDGIIQEINSTALSFLKNNTEELIGTPFSQAPWWDDNAAVAEAIKVSLKGEITRDELTINHNQKQYIFDFTFKPVKDSSGKIAIIIPEGRDITERIEYENNIISLNQSLEARVSERTEQLKIAQQQAVLANSAKTDFLSQMSHELRTPLNAIIGFSQILTMANDENLTEQQRTNIKHIEDAGKHLLSLINQTLDLSQIESGQIELKITNLNINNILEHVLTILKPILTAKSISLTNNILNKSLPSVLTDEQSLTQVLINLISNAVKYNSDRGTIEIDAKILNDKFLRISIKDTGQGIPHSLHATIFDPFTRASNVHAIEGSGIGLSLCKKLITLMDGDIGFSSIESQGSTFWIDVPLSKS